MASWQSKLRPWLARLSMSFVIIAIVLMWEGYKALSNSVIENQRTKVVMCFVGAGACMALAGAGMRERHRRDDHPE